MKIFTSTFFRISFLITVSLFVVATFVVNSPSQWNPGGLGEVLLKAMSLYLLVLFFRTSFYLGFSFVEFFNRRHFSNLDKFPLVTIIIPGYNEELVIASAIESTSKVRYPNLEILVVDDGSTDKMFLKAKEAAKKHQNVRVIAKPNGGKADALNWGIREAFGEYVLCMDADSVLDPDVLFESVPYLEAHPKLAAVAGSVLIGNPSINLLTSFQQLEYIIGLNFYKSAQSYLGIVNIVPGPIGLFRKSTLLQVGGYSTDTFAEDCDLTIRLLMNHFEVKYNPEMKAYTEAPIYANALVTQRYRWSRGVVQAIVKNTSYFWGNNTSFRNKVILLQLIGDSIVIPLVNYIFAMGTIFFILQVDNGVDVFGPFFLGLLILDVLLTLFSMFNHKRLFTLSFLSIVNRMTYGLSMEIVRFFAMIDELLRVPMKWGSLKRRGLS
jgi:cellulose synthase/poly-beta-1,6-N-acetylglucosamine synthase-like glycosyltransferase